MPTLGPRFSGAQSSPSRPLARVKKSIELRESAMGRNGKKGRRSAPDERFKAQRVDEKCIVISGVNS